MKFVFFGTPRFAEIVLQKLIEVGVPPLVVICNPDKPVGRKKIITPPPTKVLAEKHRIKVWQPEKLTVSEWNLEIGKIDFGVVAAYAKIIPDEILQLPRQGAIGVHPSLLPKYRGASPIQTAILEGETETGVTLYKMDKKIDHGPILAKETISVDRDEYYLSLEEKLANAGGKLLANTTPLFLDGKITPQEQNHEEATFTKKFETKDAEVDLENDDPETIWRKIRALNPEPGVYTFTYSKHEGKRVKLIKAKLENGKLELEKIQLEGKKVQNLSD